MKPMYFNKQICSISYFHLMFLLIQTKPCKNLTLKKQVYLVKSSTRLIVIFGFQYETHSTGPSSLESTWLSSTTWSNQHKSVLGLWQCKKNTKIRESQRIIDTHIAKQIKTCYYEEYWIINHDESLLIEGNECNYQIFLLLMFFNEFISAEVNVEHFYKTSQLTLIHLQPRTINTMLSIKNTDAGPPVKNFTTT